VWFRMGNHGHDLGKVRTSTWSTWRQFGPIPNYSNDFDRYETRFLGGCSRGRELLCEWHTHTQQDVYEICVKWWSVKSVLFQFRCIWKLNVNSRSSLNGHVGHPHMFVSSSISWLRSSPVRCGHSMVLSLDLKHEEDEDDVRRCKDHQRSSKILNKIIKYLN
jgi:hypothetical protein